VSKGQLATAWKADDPLDTTTVWGKGFGLQRWQKVMPSSSQNAPDSHAARFT
jgi:hypothetical protein